MSLISSAAPDAAALSPTILHGRLSTTPKGFGFVETSDGGPDVFVPAPHLNGALHGEPVRVRIDKVTHDGRRSGRVLAVLSQAPPLTVGRFAVVNGRPVLEPLDGRSAPWLLDGPGGFDDPLSPRNLVPGAFIQARLTRRGEGDRSTCGEVIQAWAPQMSASVAAGLAAASRGLPQSFSPSAQSEAHALPREISDQDRLGRRDLRSLPWVTIDGDTTKDFDDALAIEPQPMGGWRLWVGIADVAHYVKPGSALDAAACERGTSVYLPGVVLPMLPEALSNGLCSLNPNVDRLALVAEITFDAEGRRSAKAFHAAVIHSHARLTYMNVAQWLDAPQTSLASVGANALAVQACVQQLAALHCALDAQRRARGALDFETPEPVLHLDGEGRVDAVRASERTIAHRIVEEAMIAANVAAADHLLERGLPAPYRNHGAPCPRRLETLRQRGAVDLPGSIDLTPLHLSKAVERDPSLAPFVRQAQVKAAYEPANTGHFGLGLTSYAHFTSPIRRYPDLLVHRALWASLRADLAAELAADVTLAQLSAHLSDREATAASAERECVDRLRLDWLARQPAQARAGTVNGVTAAGLFVTLDGTGGSGFLPAPEGAQYDSRRCAWTASSQEWTLGTPVQVEVTAVDAGALRLTLGWAAPAPRLRLG